MAAVVIVGVQEVGQGFDALGLATVGAGVGPFLLEGSVVPFHLAVGLGSTWPGPLVHDITERFGEHL